MTFPIATFLKQLPIGEDGKKALLEIRKQIFWDRSDELVERMFTGDISLGRFQEEMKSEIRQLHTSSAAIGKGGWDEMGPRDWGRLGTPLRNEYQWLNRFVNYIDENRDDISFDYIRARARLYGEGGAKTTNLIEAGFTITDLLPYLPKDGSTPCLNRCHCRWELIVTAVQGPWQVVEATWHLGEAEHCEVCRKRDGRTTIIRVPVDVEVPATIGGY